MPIPKPLILRRMQFDDGKERIRKYTFVVTHNLSSWVNCTNCNIGYCGVTCETSTVQSLCKHGTRGWFKRDDSYELQEKE